MDREILYRGKRADKFKPGEWVYGYYVPCCFGSFPCRPAIVPEPDGKWEPLEVDPSTVGQYTGLTDKNRKKIFEGDICKVGNFTYQVVFKYSQWNFDIISDKIYCYPYFDTHCGGRCEVIGNIHDGKDGQNG